MFKGNSWVFESCEVIDSYFFLLSMQVDENLLPYSTSGPRNTAALVSYRSPDGEWIEENKSLK